MSFESAVQKSDLALVKEILRCLDAAYRGMTAEELKSPGKVSIGMPQITEAPTSVIEQNAEVDRQRPYRPSSCHKVRNSGPNALGLSLSVNGELRQSANTH